MDGLFAILFFAAFACFVVGIIIAIINKVKKKPAKKNLKFVGVSFLVAFVAMVGAGITAPDVPVTNQSGNNKSVSTSEPTAVTSEPIVAPTEVADTSTKAENTESPVVETQVPSEPPKATPAPSPYAYTNI